MKQQRHKSKVLKLSEIKNRCDFWGARFHSTASLEVLGLESQPTADTTPTPPKGPFRTKNSTAPESVVFCYRRCFLLCVPFSCLFLLEKQALLSTVHSVFWKSNFLYRHRPEGIFRIFFGLILDPPPVHMLLQRKKANSFVPAIFCPHGMAFLEKKRGGLVPVYVFIFPGFAIVVAFFFWP